MDQYQQKRQTYREMLLRRFPVEAPSPTYEPPTLTPLFRLNEWEEMTILIDLWTIYTSPDGPWNQEILEWIGNRLKELAILYPYVVRSISQGVPAWLRDL